MKNGSLEISPRKTPRQGRSLATFSAILEATARILEVGGLPAVTTNLVAERAGVSIGSLYQYFPSKDAIVAELIREQRTDMLNDLSAAAEATRGVDLRGTATQMIKASILHHARRPDLASVLESAEEVLPLEAEAKALKAAIQATVIGVLKRHDVPNPAEAAQDLSAMTRAIVEAAAKAGETDFDAVLHRVCRAAFGYLGIYPNSP